MPDISSGSKIGEQLQILHMRSQELLDKQPGYEKKNLFAIL